MEKTIRINTDMLTADIIEEIKKLFPHKTVDITIQDANTNELQEPASEYKTSKTDFSDSLGSLTEEEAEAMKKVIEENFERINPDDWK